jgi:hypothetical protein
MQNMEEITIIKGWNKTYIIRTFKNEFQLATTEANATTSLFNVTLNIKEHNEIDMEIDLIEATLTIMEKCLQQTNAITTINYTPVSSTRSLK